MRIDPNTKLKHLDTKRVSYCRQEENVWKIRLKHTTPLNTARTNSTLTLSLSRSLHLLCVTIFHWTKLFIWFSTRFFALLFVCYLAPRFHIGCASSTRDFSLSLCECVNVKESEKLPIFVTKHFQVVAFSVNLQFCEARSGVCGLFVVFGISCWFFGCLAICFVCVYRHIGNISVIDVYIYTSSMTWICLYFWPNLQTCGLM